MAENLSYSFFPIHNEATTNDQSRPGDMILEYHEAEAITIGTNEGTAEVVTGLSVVKGLIHLNYISSAADPTDSIVLLTDGVITSGAVTVNAKTVDVADGAITTRFFLVGTKGSTVLFNTPDNPS